MLTKILVDGGDPDETLRVKKLLGFVDGQTTNPSLIAKNPEIQQRIASGDTLSPQEEKEEYQKIVQAISPLLGDAGVSIEVFADLETSAEEMLAQGKEMFTWVPNAYIKFRKNRRLRCMPQPKDRRSRCMYRRLWAGSMTLAKTALISSRTCTWPSPFLYIALMAEL